MTTVSTGGSLIGKIGSYLQIVAKDPSSTAFVPLAEAYRQTGLLDDALEAANLGTKRLPHFSPGFSTLGRILGQMGRIDEAMSAYARALSIDRQSQSGLIGLARLHLIRSERDLARKILQQAQEFHPDDEMITDMLNALDLPRPWSEIRQASQPQETTETQETQETQEITTTEEKSTETPAELSETPIPTATLAEIYVKQGLLNKAVKVYEDIVQNNPNNQAALTRIQQLKEQSLDSSVSINDAEPVVETAPVETQRIAEISEPMGITAEPELVHEEVLDRSPLAVLHRWLAAIKKGRTHV